ncbi:MAG: hypothetical protein ACLQEQ_09690 [Nitrososphaerales archaeon]
MKGGIAYRLASMPHASLKKGLLAAVIVLLTVSLAAAPRGYAAAQPATGAPNQLSVDIIPPKLPADGGTYPAVVVSLEDSSGHPSAALTDVTVYLSSSSSNVAKIQNPIVIALGDLYATADLTTTVTPGTTTITASSAGLQAASTQAITATPSGFPSRIKVFLAPDTVISGPSYNGLVILELLDQLGLPARAGNDTLVQLSSSDTSVANVSQDSMVIRAGQIVATGNYSTAYIPGQAEVVAVASGLLTGSDVLTVTGSSPLYLQVFTQPAKIGLSSTGRLSLGLTDESGNPTRAPANLAVQITSSNPSVAKTPSLVIIPAGSSFALSNFTTTTVAGTASLTFSASGLNSGTPVLVTSLAASSAPAELQVLVGPTLVLADQQGYSAVVVSLVNSASDPAVAPPGGQVVHLTSSDTQVGSVPPTVTIQAGNNFASLVFTSTFFAGTTTITAFANGLQTGFQSIATFGPVPAKLELRGVPGTLPADGNSYGALEVLLEDSSGGPAFAPSEIVVQLLSSESNIVSVNTSVIIPAGSYFALTDVLTTLLPGSANITAFAASLSPALITLQTRIPAPSAVAAYVSPPVSLISGVSPNPILVVQLQDSSGNPARAGADTLAIVTSSNDTVLKSPILMVIPKGEDYVKANLNVTSSGSTTLTAASSGLAASTVGMTVAGLTLTKSVSQVPASATIFSDSTSTLQIVITVEGVPVPGVTASWNSTTGAVGPNFTVTNDNGFTSTIFTPPSANSNGVAVVKVALSSQVFGTANAIFTVIYSPQPVAPPPTLADRIGTFLIYVLPIVVAYIAIAVFVTIRSRRRKAREELEAGFQTLS